MNFVYHHIKFIVRFLLLVILGAAYMMVAHADMTPSSETLSMDSAIRRAIQTQLTTKLAESASLEARGRAIQAAASLLPHITGSVSQARIFKTNLAAEGFESSSFLPDPVIGPYNTFDARFELVQKLLDFNSIWNTKAANADAQTAKLQEDLAAEQVASAAALAYIEDLRAHRDVEDAQANFALAQKLSTLAHHQHDAGLATGVDVARAETRTAQDHQRLIQAQLAVSQADVRLKRVVGMPLADSFTIVDSSETFSSNTPAENGLISQALSDRVELLITRQQIKSESYAVNAARANFLPVVSASADYGFSGNLPSGSARTGSIGGRLDLPIFTGGETHGQIVEAKGRLTAAQSQHADTVIQVEEDVRLALQTLPAEADEMQVARTQVQLAERELQMAQDRYAAGAGDNIQVITAEASVEDARKTLVDARASYADAQANLAMALGHMRTFTL